MKNSVKSFASQCSGFDQKGSNDEFDSWRWCVTEAWRDLILIFKAKFANAVKIFSLAFSIPSPSWQYHKSWHEYSPFFLSWVWNFYSRMNEDLLFDFKCFFDENKSQTKRQSRLFKVSQWSLKLSLQICVDEGKCRRRIRFHASGTVSWKLIGTIIETSISIFSTHANARLLFLSSMIMMMLGMKNERGKNLLAIALIEEN